MLISFSIDNWMSFGNKTKFSMIGSRERRFSERVPKIKKYDLKVLPIAAIYGGNASGKTNLFRALEFVKKFVISGSKISGMVPVETFLLDKKKKDGVSSFSMELLIDEIIYEFSFTANAKKVLHEKLVKVTSTSETTLYERNETRIKLGKKLKLKEKNRLKFAGEGTDDNQLFLTNSISQKIETFSFIYNWFKEQLILMDPDSKCVKDENFMDRANPFSCKISKALEKLDTGIVHIDGEDISFSQIEGASDELKTMLMECLEDGDRALRPPDITVVRKNDELFFKKLITYHSDSNNEDIKFGIKNESDGTIRLMDLLPAFFAASDSLSKKVFFIDELDRSLHTLLTRKLLELYLRECSIDSRSQLLFTTHDVMLMDQNFLRRDEMWLAKRNTESGESSLSSVSDYKDVRYDKDLKKDYLLGRLEGVPEILLSSLNINKS